MTTQLKVVEVPLNCRTDVVGTLRELADSIERGEYGDAYNIAWVVDCGDGRIEQGLLGMAAEPSLTAYFLHGIAQRRFERVASSGEL